MKILFKYTHYCLNLKNMEVAIIMQFLQEVNCQNMLKIKEIRLKNCPNIFQADCKRNEVQSSKQSNPQRSQIFKQIKIKIIDFGIAGAITFLTQQDLDTGSLAYMTPQFFTSNKDYKVDGRIDVWATGVILYYMLHGSLLFKGANNHQVIQAIKAGKYIIQPIVQKTVSEACINLLKQCLQVNTKKRPSMKELAYHSWLNKSIFVVKQKIEAPKMEIIKEQVIPKEKVKNKTIPSKPNNFGSKFAKPGKK